MQYTREDSGRAKGVRTAINEELFKKAVPQQNEMGGISGVGSRKQEIGSKLGHSPPSLLVPSYHPSRFLLCLSLSFVVSRQKLKLNSKGSERRTPRTSSAGELRWTAPSSRQREGGAGEGFGLGFGLGPGVGPGFEAARDGEDTVVRA